MRRGGGVLSAVKSGLKRGKAPRWQGENRQPVLIMLAGEEVVVTNEDEA
jgi:hypothetical protein